MRDIEGLPADNEVLIARTRNVGTISLKAIAYRMAGPMLRAWGLPWDLRRTEPYSVSSQLEFDIPVGTSGDCYDRSRLWLEEIKQSMRMVEQ